MDNRQSNLLLSLKEVQKFLSEHGAKLADISQSGIRRKLDAAVVELSGSAAVQSGSGIASKSATRTQGVLVRELIDEHMWPIARVAAMELAPLPAISPLAMPKARETGERLVARARGMANEAKKFEPTFIEGGLPLDFLQQLHLAADAVSAAISERKQRLGERGGATEVLKKQIAQGRKILKVLDAFMKKAAKKDTALLAAWRIVKRLRQAAGAKLPTPVGTPPFDATGGTE